MAATRDAVSDAAQQRLVRGLVASGRPVLVLAPAGRLPVAIPAAAGGQAFAYGTGLSY
ncbi:MAG TPA: hypothetical protein VE464_08095 [Streptosporangiaceae bacterium]|nr:hypothetical protein [Streptosporangiaceae bacterium]